MPNVKAREWNLLSLSNGLETFCKNTAIQQRHDKEEHLTAEISSLPDSFEAVKTHGFKSSFCNPVP